MSDKTKDEIQKDLIELIGELAEDAGYDRSIVEALQASTLVALAMYADAVLVRFYEHKGV